MSVTLRRRMPLLFGLIASGLVAAGGSVSAQSIVGRVLERGGGGPVAGAMVRLALPGGGATARSWLTATDGRFQLDAPNGGAFDILVERIGFQTTTLRGIEVADNGIVSVDVVVEAEAVQLEGLEVEAEGGRCRLDESGGATQLLWDEARKALAAASWTESSVNLRFEVSVWDRQISPRTSQILFEERNQRETVGANSVQSLPPEDLARDGYVRTNPSYAFYYAPDARVLLSDEFLATHCFHTVEAEDGGSVRLGLGFTPLKGRDVPDVKGVIWVDEVSGRLDRVEFQYEGLSIPGADRARGEVRWAELADGRWIVRDWFIQVPMARGTRATPGAIRRGGLAAIHEVGNQVDLVEGDGFTWRPEMAPGTVRGLVYDSVSGGALAGAEVRVAGRGWRTRTDLSGRFELKGVAPGLHRLTFTHPELDSLGVTPGWETVTVEPAGVSEVELTVPRWETLLALSCGDEGGGALVGVVRRRDGALVGGATVEVEGLTTAEGTRFTDVSDARGAYVLCGVPKGVVRLHATRGRAVSGSIEMRLGDATFTQADLTLEPPPVMTQGIVPGALRPALVGTVLASGSREPIEDVVVQLLDEEGDAIASALSDAEGAFRMVLDRPAPVVFLSVQRLGYTGAVSEALDLSEGTRRVEVTLPQEAVEIDPVVVVVEGRVPRLEREGFYARATTMPGLFIRRDDIDAVAPARTSDLLERAPGVRSFTDPLAGDLRRRIVFTRLTLRGGDRCYPALFVNGEMVRLGGSRDTPEAPPIEGVEPPQGERVASLDELVVPHEIEAVEMYPTPGQVPRRFVGLGTKCGVIVVWTRGNGPGK
jgi:Carboxypeptidase regulatory-like domain